MFFFFFCKLSVVAASPRSYPAFTLSYLPLQSPGHPSCTELCLQLPLTLLHKISWSMSVLQSSSHLILQQCYSPGHFSPSVLSPREQDPRLSSGSQGDPTDSPTSLPSRFSNHSGMLTLTLQRPMTAMHRRQIKMCTPRHRVPC